MTNISAYIKPRIVIIFVALLFVILFKIGFKDDTKNIAPKPQVLVINKSKSHTPVVKSAKKTEMTTKNKKLNTTISTKNSCMFPNKSIPDSTILKTIFISIYPLHPLKENNKLDKYLGRTKGKITLNNIEDFHLAGKIIFYRAIYLQSQLNNNKKIENRWGITIPSSKSELKTKYLNLFNQAQQLLVKIRPFPKYKMWSDALYLNAWSLYQLGNIKESIRFLNIIARTNSQAKPAIYARFALGILFSQNGRYKESIVQFKKIKKIDTKFNYIKNFYTKIDKIMLSNNISNSILKVIDEYKTQKDLLNGFLKLLSMNCKIKDDPAGYVKSLINSIPAQYKTGFLTDCGAILNKRSQADARNQLCKMAKGLK